MRPVVPRAGRVRSGSILAAVLLLSAGLAGLAAAAPSGDTTFVATAKPSLAVTRAAGPITIDGDLTDPGWQGAAHATNFCEWNPGDRVKPPVATDAFITYDADRLYVAWVCQDDPKSIRGTLRDRDQAFDGDYVGIILDTYGAAAWAYELFVSPAGVQGDLLWTPNSEDEKFDMVWTSKAKITATGWQVEAAIPFSSLRFPNKESQTWRATFWRNRPRTSRGQYTWAAMSRDDNCWACQFGTLNGIEHVHPAAGLEILPSVVASQSASLGNPDDIRSGLHNDNVKADLGGYLRYVFASNLTAEGTVNPDFSQVEADAAQIDVNTTFALFYPEKRPFFQEGSDLFETWVNAVYTRSVNDPSVATRATMRRDRTSFAWVGARDEHSPIILPFEDRSGYLLGGQSITNLARVKQTFGQSSYVGFLATDRRLDGGGSGSVVGLDGTLSFLKRYRFEWQGTVSRTVEPNDSSLTLGIASVQPTFERGAHTTAFDGEEFGGHAAYLSLERDGRTWSFDYDFWATSPAFRAANGFITRNDERKVIAWNGVNFWPKHSVVERFQPSLDAARLWNYAGVGKDKWLRPQLFAQFKAQTNVSVAYLWSHERFRDVEFPGIRRLEVNVNSNFSNPVTAGMWLSTGRGIL